MLAAIIAACYAARVDADVATLRALRAMLMDADMLHVAMPRGLPCFDVFIDFR